MKDIELYRDSFQNFRSYQLPKAQLVTTYDHLAYLKKYIPDKYRKSLGRKRHGQGNKRQNTLVGSGERP